MINITAEDLDKYTQDELFANFNKLMHDALVGQPFNTLNIDLLKSIVYRYRPYLIKYNPAWTKQFMCYFVVADNSIIFEEYYEPRWNQIEYASGRFKPIHVFGETSEHVLTYEIKLDGIL